MYLFIIQTDVFPQYSSYQTNNGDIAVNIGFLIGSLNSMSSFSNRFYTLKDISGNIIQEGVVSVKLNSFDTTLTFTNLNLNSIYTLSIYNTASGNITSCVIATGTIIGTIDETMKITDTNVSFTDNLKFIDGFISFKSSTIFPTSNTQMDNTIGTYLTDNAFLGNSIVSIGSQLYAFRPSKLFTNNASVGSTILYTPFIGLSTYSVPVFQLASQIFKVGDLQYSINPPSTLRVKYGSQIVEFNEPVSFIDLSLSVVREIGSTIFIEQTFSV